MLSPVTSRSEHDALAERFSEFERDRHGYAVASADRTYLVRSRRRGAHDTLTAMRVSHVDDDGIIFTWRTLMRWSVPRTEPRRPERVFDISSAPRWMLDMPSDALDSWQEDAQTAFTSRLFTPSSDRVTHLFRRGDYEHLLSRDVLLAHEGFLDELLTSGEVGSYFDFGDRSHGGEGDPDIRYDPPVFSVQKAGGLVGIGSVPLQDVDADMPPVGLDEMQLNRWRALVEPDAVAMRSSGRPRAMNVSSARVIVGDTYLLRTVDHRVDMLVAFVVTEEFDHGVAIEWRELRE